ncbi:hypothetical protein MSG28_005460 [Choristoneura fumiferana]|nr:hypothetical protein MSG28_005460 [Choristoneura fumiferana]
MDGGNVDLQLSDDPYDSKLLDVTLCKIGEKCVVDPSAEEESCSAVSLIVGVTGNPRHYSTEALDAVPEGGKCSTIAINGPGSVAQPTLKDAIKQGM